MLVSVIRPISTLRAVTTASLLSKAYPHTSLGSRGTKSLWKCQATPEKPQRQGGPEWDRGFGLFLMSHSSLEENSLGAQWSVKDWCSGGDQSPGEGWSIRRVCNVTRASCSLTEGDPKEGSQGNPTAGQTGASPPWAQPHSRIDSQTVATSIKDS